jgi:hypothetical protein
MAQRSEIKKNNGIKIKFNIVGNKYQDGTTLTIVAGSPGMDARKNIDLAVAKNTKFGRREVVGEEHQQRRRLCNHGTTE